MKNVKIKDFDAIALSIASPEDVLGWSSGEITKPETINYRTQKPEREGLFCEKVFGPVKNWECACGKYKRIRYKGITCERCGVEVTRSIVRRERMGHIKLAVPVTHTWFLRSTPSRVGLLLDLSVKQLEQVVYFAAYLVVDMYEEDKIEAVKELENDYQKILDQRKIENKEALSAAKSAVKSGDMEESDLAKLEQDLVDALEEVANNYKESKDQLEMLEVGLVLTETQYREASMKFGHVFRAGVGAEAIREVISMINLDKFIEEQEHVIKNSSGQKQKKAIKRMKLGSSLKRSGIKPEWMILTVIPVIPPELRPMVQLDGGRFATSDLNDLYRRVINRNMRLKKLIQLGAPEIICRNEKRMLQEAVDILISNSVRNSRSGVNQVQRRKLKSLSDMLKGKQGRFRQNLLGKRVDYSGRSVIVVGPNLKMHECGLPKKIALELFKPFVLAKLISFELAHNVKSAEKLIRAGEKIVWDILDEVIEGRYVLLNRAPTLHRLGIQAFQPRLVEGKAIQLHPLVCAAFNADFDGDQMAVHLPLSKAAQKEAREIMISTNNLLKPSGGEPIVSPSQDMVLGCYFLTQKFKDRKGAGATFVSPEEAIFAYDSEKIHLQAPINVRINGEIVKDTTVGRIIFNEILPEEIEYKNISFGKKALNDILNVVFRNLGVPVTAKLADDIKDLGFKYATLSGVTISAFDLKTPRGKDEIIEVANNIVEELQSQYKVGLITDEERYNHTIKTWTKVKADITENMIKEYDNENDIFYQIDSGARGNWGQITQMAGMKGLVASPSGKTIELPIRSNLKEGFTILEYFIATHGGRKGKSDTALKTAEAGYLTRRLVDSVQDVIVREVECGTKIFKTISKENSDAIGVDYLSRVYGLVLGTPALDPKGKEIFPANTLISDDQLDTLRDTEVDSVEVRTVMYCRTLGGVCQNCYGQDLGNRKIADIGMSAGIVAAQSIGEPGTQLTMRTFHMGGVATEGASITQGLTRVDELFEARSPKMPAVLAEITGEITLKRGKNDITITLKAKKAEGDIYDLSLGFEAAVKKGDKIREKQIIARSTEDKSTLKSLAAGVVKSVKNGEIIIKQDEAQKRVYKISNRVSLKINDGDLVKKGDALTLGHIDLRELMALTSVERVQEYILYEVQHIYASQGQNINEKHIEIIAKQMASKVRIIDGGTTRFLPGEVKDLIEVSLENVKIEKAGGKGARFERLLLGLTRISIWTDSWLSAASFQETIRVLVEASTTRQIDTLDGLKENVIIGRLIPAGRQYKKLLEAEAERKKAQKKIKKKA